MAVDITELCKQNHTDKHRGEFPHSKLYDTLFASFRDQPICLLEIGINRGGSIPVWEQYFPNAKLLMVDINPISLLRTTDRTKIELVDQSDAEALKNYADNNGPFNIIIDDGSHLTGDQIITFETLWPYILPGGVFVIEDTLTSYSGIYKFNYINSNITCVDYFKLRIDDINKTVKNRPKLYKDINTIIIKQNMIVITKREKPESWMSGEQVPHERDKAQAKKDLKFREDLKGSNNGE